VNVDKILSVRFCCRP